MTLFLLKIIGYMILVLPLVPVVGLGYQSWRKRTWRWVAPFLAALALTTFYVFRVCDFMIYVPNPGSVKDSTVIWDQQDVGGETFLLTRNLKGFVDVMEGVQLFRYPKRLGTHPSRYRDRYEMFDMAVDDMFEGRPRAVTGAKLDLKGHKVFVEFTSGPPQVLNIELSKPKRKE